MSCPTDTQQVFFYQRFSYKKILICNFTTAEKLHHPPHTHKKHTHTHQHLSLLPSHYTLRTQKFKNTLNCRDRHVIITTTKKHPPSLSQVQSDGGICNKSREACWIMRDRERENTARINPPLGHHGNATPPTRSFFSHLLSQEKQIHHVFV